MGWVVCGTVWVVLHQFATHLYHPVRVSTRVVHQRPQLGGRGSQFRDTVSFLRYSFSTQRSLSQVLFYNVNYHSTFLLLFCYFLPLSPPVVPVGTGNHPPLPFSTTHFHLPTRTHLPFRAVGFWDYLYLFQLLSFLPFVYTRFQTNFTTTTTTPGCSIAPRETFLGRPPGVSIPL